MTDRVLLVEDDDTVRSLLRLLLEDDGLQVVEAASGPEAIDRFDDGQLDLVMLDVRLPGQSGFEVCRHIRRHSSVPIIMVTAQQDSHDVVTGLELGADDYVTKPFNDRELIARVRVQLRRRSNEPKMERIDLGDLQVMPDEGVATKRGEPLTLTRTEFHLLCHLGRSLNRVWSREQLLQQVWGYEYSGDGRLVDTHVARLRAKLEDDPANPQWLITVRGLGYKMVKGGG